MVDKPADYEHSTVQFYILNEECPIPITTYLELQDIDLTILTPQVLEKRNSAENKIPISRYLLITNIVQAVPNIENSIYVKNKTKGA